jgi:pantothenate kinase
MCKAGVDLGSTLIKFAWEEIGGNGKNRIRFASTANRKVSQIVKDLTSVGVTSAFGTGINRTKDKILEPIAVLWLGGDPIENEIRVQADGARKLLEMMGKSEEVKEFLLVSVGTGISYTTVYRNSIRRFPYGNGIGGGFVGGILAIAGIPTRNINDPGATGGARSLDLKVKDIITDTEGTFTGELIVSHFGSAVGLGFPENIIQSALNCVATNIVRDILKQDMMEKFKPPKHVVFIGSTIARCVVLENMLEKYFANLSKNMPNWNHEAIFPPHADFAGALGALMYGR